MADTCALCSKPKAPDSAYFCAEHQAQMRPRSAPAATTPPKKAHGVGALIVVAIIVAVIVGFVASRNGGGGGGGSATPTVTRHTSCAEWSSWSTSDRVDTAGSMADAMGAYDQSYGFAEKFQRMLLTACQGDEQIGVEDAAAGLATLDRSDFS